MRKYPRLGTIYPKRRSKRDGATTCLNCDNPIKVGDSYAAVDIQYSYMRGDDDVVIVCKPCSRGPLHVHELIKKAAKQCLTTEP